MCCLEGRGVLLANTKKIQAAISSAFLRLSKLNFPMLMAMVFSTARMKSRKSSMLSFKTKKKKAEKPKKTMENSTTKVARPEKQSLMVAAICEKKVKCAITGSNPRRQLCDWTILFLT